MSILGGFRRISLKGHRMPPRTTQKSHRPRVSDRTMVGNCQHTACKRKRRRRKNANEYDAESLPRMRERKPRPGEVCCRCQQGLDVRKNPSPGRSGEVFLLDIPFYRTRHREITISQDPFCILLPLCNNKDKLYANILNLLWVQLLAQGSWIPTHSAKFAEWMGHPATRPTIKD